MRKRRELAPPKLPLVSKFISPRSLLEEFSGKKKLPFGKRQGALKIKGNERKRSENYAIDSRDEELGNP